MVSSPIIGHELRIGALVTVIDHLKNTSARVITCEHGFTRVVGDDISVHFGREDPGNLRDAINVAMDQMLRHYKVRNMKNAAETHLSSKQLNEMTLHVVLNFLYMYSNWKSIDEKYKELELKLQPGDFDHVQAHRQCYWYCESNLKHDFRVAAAALMGKTDQELRDYELGQEYFENR